MASPPPPVPQNSQPNGRRKRIVPQRRLAAIQRKVRDDLHDSVLQWTVGT